MIIHLQIEQRLRQVAAELFPGANPDLFRVRPCSDPRHGDYQTSGLISLAKTLKRNPEQIASQVASRLAIADLCHPVEIAGTGFLNFRLRQEALASALAAAATPGSPLFHERSSEPRTVIIDYSSPNVAKPMHIGHIRSTILGDCLARVLRLLGHRVITDNHIGDWGTQFGKLIVGWKQQLDAQSLERDPIGEMERLYRIINKAGEDDPTVLESVRRELVKLQAGDEENLQIWREMIALSQKQFDTVYARLGVQFDHTLGESFYNPWLMNVVQDLASRGLAQESEGAMVVFFPDHPELKGKPAIIRKSDGAANYTTTDLATLSYRVDTWNPHEIIYVTDGRQQLHFKQLFAVFERWRPEFRIKLNHVWFGSILGEDGKPFKTRSGDTVRLVDLLDEAEERAFKVVTDKNPDLSAEARREIARIVGIGAVKYSDLLPNRQSDYVFSWEKMLAFNGNTAPYLLYAYTRIQSIFRKGEIAEFGIGESKFPASAFASLSEPDELALAKQLLNFGLILEAVARENRPNYLCNYLYDLAGRFARFYESCPVLKADGVRRTARIALCRLSARVLRQGLDTLGLETTEQM